MLFEKYYMRKMLPLEERHKNATSKDVRKKFFIEILQNDIEDLCNICANKGTIKDKNDLCNINLLKTDIENQKNKIVKEEC